MLNSSMNITKDNVTNLSDNMSSDDETHDEDNFRCEHIITVNTDDHG